ncbi:MAG: Rho termination factor N-terminal domain-containing protein, partial [Actinomycetota bacterium]
MDSGTLERQELESKVLPELQEIAQTLGIEGHQRLRKGDLITAILEKGNGEVAVEDVITGDVAAPTDASAERNGDEMSPSDRESAGGVATTTGERPMEPSGDGQEQRRPEGPRGQGGRPGGAVGERPPQERRGRLSREERRRQRELRREREIQEREEELATAPTRTGILDILPEGYGFLRTTGYLPGPEDVYVSLSQIRRFALRRGDGITGKVRNPRDNEKYPALLQIETVNDVDPEVARGRPEFDKLTPLFPDERYRLEHVDGQKAITERIIDLVSPVGKGQRGMVVSPPKAGKTTILKQIAGGILASDAETHLIILLVDERPEEVTDWQRTVPASEVVYSTFDKPADQHTQVTELVLERA